MRRAAALVGAMVSGLAFVACGSSEDGPPPRAKDARPASTQSAQAQAADYVLDVRPLASARSADGVLAVTNTGGPGATVFVTRTESLAKAPDGWEFVSAAYSVRLQVDGQETSRLREPLFLDFTMPLAPALVVRLDGDRWTQVGSSWAEGGAIRGRMQESGTYAVVRMKRSTAISTVGQIGPTPAAVVPVRTPPPAVAPTITALAYWSAPIESESQAWSRVEDEVGRLLGRDISIAGRIQYQGYETVYSRTGMLYGVFSGASEVIADSGHPTSTFLMFTEPRFSMPANDVEARAALEEFLPGATLTGFTPVLTKQGFVFGIAGNSRFTAAGIVERDGAVTIFYVDGSGTLAAAARTASATK